MQNVQNTLKIQRLVLNQLNWSAGTPHINEADFKPIKFEHLPFPRLQAPFSQCSFMRVCVPNSKAYDDQGDPILYAMVEVGDQQGTKFHAKPTLEFTRTTLIPVLTEVNKEVRSEDKSRQILYP